MTKKFFSTPGFRIHRWKFTRVKTGTGKNYHTPGAAKKHLDFLPFSLYHIFCAYTLFIEKKPVHGVGLNMGLLPGVRC
jgi:hypothetical protein